MMTALKMLDKISTKIDILGKILITKPLELEKVRVRAHDPVKFK